MSRADRWSPAPVPRRRWASPCRAHSVPPSLHRIRRCAKRRRPRGAEPVAPPRRPPPAKDRRPYGKPRESWRSSLVGGRIGGDVFRGARCRGPSPAGFLLSHPAREGTGRPSVFAALRWIMGPYRDSGRPALSGEHQLHRHFGLFASPCWCTTGIRSCSKRFVLRLPACFSSSRWARLRLLPRRRWDRSPRWTRRRG